MSTGGVRDLFRSTRIRETTIIIMLNQFVRGIINYGFLFNIGGLGGNIYYNNIINNLTGIPAFLMLCCAGSFELLVTVNSKRLFVTACFITRCKNYQKLIINGLVEKETSL